MMPHIPAMEKIISCILEILPDEVSIKATTTEGLGFEGREEGISAQAVVLLRKI
jgi:2-C-methyl-D-erythritol 2,4-cyclodiphosphate synthase